MFDPIFGIQPFFGLKGAARTIVEDSMRSKVLQSWPKERAVTDVKATMLRDWKRETE